jgi:hypothetical protein
MTYYSVLARMKYSLLSISLQSGEEGARAVTRACAMNGQCMIA